MPARPGNEWIDSPDISSVIQQVVSRAGWANGNALVAFMIENPASNNYRDIYYYESGNILELIVTWTTD